MGTTGLETAFAAVYTDLVLPGVLPLALVVEQAARRARRCWTCRCRGSRRDAGGPVPGRPRREWEVGEAGYESRSENCCFAGRTLHRPGAGDDRRRRRRLPRALVRAESRRDAGLRAARGRHPLRRRGRRRAPARSTGEVVFTTGMSGYQESVTDPSFHAPDHHLHLPAHRQLRRLRPRRWSPTACHARAVDHARGDQRARTPRAPSAAGWTGSRDCGVPGDHAASTRARSSATSATAGAMRGGIFPAAMAETEARERVAAEPSMVGRDLAREVTLARPDGPSATATARASSRSTPGSSARSSRNFTSRGATLELYPCTTPRRRAAGARPRRRSSSCPGPGDPAALDYLVDTIRALLAPQAGVRHLPRPPAALAAPSGWRRSSCRSATAAPTTRSRTCATGPDRDHLARTTASRSRASPASRAAIGLRRGRADAREPLRRHGRGHPPARRPRRLRPVPPRGGAGPARLARPVRRLHRGPSSVPRSATTSTRSSSSAPARS